MIEPNFLLMHFKNGFMSLSTLSEILFLSELIDFGSLSSLRVVGKGSVHIIDYWLVEFDIDFGPTYPYKVFSVPHVAILNE